MFGVKLNTIPEHKKNKFTSIFCQYSKTTYSNFSFAVLSAEIKNISQKY